MTADLSIDVLNSFGDQLIESGQNIRNIKKIYDLINTEAKILKLTSHI